MNISYGDPALDTEGLVQLLENVMESLWTHLASFVDRPTFIDDLSTAFGFPVDAIAARQLIDHFIRDGLVNDSLVNDSLVNDGLVNDGLTDKIGDRPLIQIRGASDINGAYGAFSADTNTIYLSHEFLLAHRTEPAAITSVLLEELGHFIDANLPTGEMLPADSKGDEGAIFSAVVQDITLSPSQLALLYAEDDHVTVELEGQTVQLEQATAGSNPAFDLIGLTRLRNDPRFAGIDGSGVSVAVIDTGLDASHPLIQPNFATFVDFVDGRTDPFDVGSHGTHVSGTVGARDEDIGVAPEVDLIGLQVFHSTAEGLRARTTDVSEALEWVLDNHEEYNIVAVNMSLGGGFYASEQDAFGDPRIPLIEELEREGITIVSSAGNFYDFKDDRGTVINQAQNLSAPAIFSTLAVGAVWQDGNDRFGQYRNQQVAGRDRLAVFSQRLNAPNVLFAPGALINSTVPGDGVDQWPGTSMASPHVAGVVALMQEAAMQFGGRLLDPREIVDILRSTADTVFDGDDEQDTVLNTNISYPRLNAFNALDELYKRFQSLGGATGDPNGTLRGAILGPILDGESVLPVPGSIGSDGDTTTVGNTDVDIIQFEVLTSGIVTLEVASSTEPSSGQPSGQPTEQPDAFDSFLRLFDRRGNQLDFSDDIDQSNRFSKIDIFLQPGIYYAGVSGYDNSDYNPNRAGSGVAGSEGNYELRFTLDSPDPDGLLAGAVDVRLGTSREPVTFDEHIGTDFGALVGVTDVDLFKVVVPDNGTLLIDIDTPYEDNFVDSFLRLFDQDGNELFFPGGDPFESDDDLSFDRVGNSTEFTDTAFPSLTFEEPGGRSFSGHTLDSFLGAVVERGETYYIGVSDFSNQDYNPSNLDNRRDSGNGGRYQLIIEFVNNDLDGSVDQAISTLGLPIIGQRGVIGTDDDPETNGVSDVGNKDVDFVKIRSATRGILEIDIDAYTDPSQLPNGNPVDAVVLLFDSDGNILASNDDGDSLDPFLQIEIDANTDYFVAVTGYGNDNFDPFALGSGLGGDTGEYILNSTLLPYSSLASLSDNAIQTSTIDTIEIGIETSGDIGRDDNFVVGAADVDLYRLVPNDSGVISIRTATNVLASPEDSGADTMLRLFNSSGTEIAFNDNEAGDTRSSLIEASVQAGQEYFIGVNGSSAEARNYNPLTGAGAMPGSQGSYSLIVEDVIPNTDGNTGGDNSGNPDDSISDTTVGNPSPSGTGTVSNPGTIVSNTSITGGADGNGRIIGTSSNDRLVGSGGNDWLIGNAGNDRLVGKAGNDRLTGGGGNDKLIGGSGKDLLIGGGGKDNLKGGKDKDILKGGGGNDVLDGGKGSDVLIGGQGNDIFRLRKKDGRDKIKKFQNGLDKIDLVGRLSFDDLDINGKGKKVLLSVGNNDLAQLTGVRVSQINAADFI